MNEVKIEEDSIIVKQSDTVGLRFEIDDTFVLVDEWRCIDLELSADDCEALGQKFLEFANRIRAKNG